MCCAVRQHNLIINYSFLHHACIKGKQQKTKETILYTSCEELHQKWSELFNNMRIFSECLDHGLQEKDIITSLTLS